MFKMLTDADLSCGNCKYSITKGCASLSNMWRTVYSSSGNYRYPVQPAYLLLRIGQRA